MSRYIKYTIRDFEIDTIDKFLDQFGLSIARSLTKNSLLSIIDENGISNLDRIWISYTADQQEQYETLYETGQLNVVNFNTTICLPKDSLFIETVGVIGKNQLIDQSSFTGFLADKLQELIADKQYKTTIKTNTSNEIQNINNHISVWVWCKALSNLQQDSSEKLLNITPFITSLTTNVDSNGGNFSIQTAPVTCKLINNEWSIDFSTNTDFQTTEQLYTDKKINNFLLSNLIGSNDVVFIRFERLDLENDSNINNLVIDKSNIPSSQANTRVYDMIGLVDDCIVDLSSQNNDGTISIKGRDLMKLLIDDGSYFYPLQYAQGVFINPSENTKLIKRLAVDGQFILQSSFAFRSISYSLQYILNHLANIKICPDDLFDYYGDRRSLVYRISDTDKSQVDQSALDRIKDNVFDIIKNITGDENSSILIAIFNDIQTVIATAESENALLTNGQGLIGYSTFSLARANNTPSNILQYGIGLFRVVSARGGVDQGEDTFTVTTPTNIFNLAYQYYLIKNNRRQVVDFETQAKGIWQIVKLAVDQTVSDRRVVDSSISQPDGSLINQFWKVCQDPFVEFYGDTYGDQYYFVARKPPFDKQSILSFIENDSIITIDSVDTLSINVQFESQEIYSFYEIIPQGLFAGQGSEVSLAYIPIIYFPQYADIWGTKRLSVVSNYLSYKGLIGESDNEDSNFLVTQSALDLKYLIETNAYLPFSRKGTIVINGNRTIKKGTWIYSSFTDEYFYVDAVSNSANINNQAIDRTTTLEVSRGLKKKFLTGPVNYFNIINTDLITKFIVASLTQSNETVATLSNQIKQNFAVNEAVFNFFLKRLQFDE